MSMPIYKLLPLLLALAACGDRNSDNRVLTQAEANQSSDAADGGRVECALAGAKAFARTCTLDRAEGADGLFLTLHHPDGGFDRLQVTKDGRGVVAADGAQPAVVKLVGSDTIEVAIGADRYRLPATVRGTTPPAG